MQKEVERVVLNVVNGPGVLGRVLSHVRHEGWNVKRLYTEEQDERGSSDIEMDIEGSYTKLAQVIGSLNNLDCVLSVSMMRNGEKIVSRNEKKPQGGEHVVFNKKAEPVCPKPENAFRILTINPGSTSTKFALYDDENEVMAHTIRHDRKELDSCGSVFGQKGLRKKLIMDMLLEAEVELSSLDAVSGRGGLVKPIESGTYLINDAMLSDLQLASAAIHASSLGALIAHDIASELGLPAYVVDPVVVDEMYRHAKLSGMPGIDRSSIFHALNHKAVARRHAKEVGRPYESLRFVVAHLGGGISVGAHRYGRVIDVNDGLYGEGPFSPERSGGVPAIPLIRMCFSGEYTEEELIARVAGKGGMQGYLGTNDMRKVQNMINAGDDFATVVMDSMAYQVCKEIGAMIAVLEGRADAIILTGGLAYSNRFTGAIKQRVDMLAPVYVYPGEDEMLALMEGALRVLQGKEAAAIYE